MNGTTPAPPQQVQDMFGDNASNTPSTRRRVTPRTPPPPSGPERRGPRFSTRTIASIAIVIILVGAIVGIAIARRFAKDATNTNATNSVTSVTNSSGIPVNVSLTNIPPSFAVNRSKDVTSQDLDGDGLTNLEEVQAGTSIEDPDSDHDGLTDYQEVVIYRTNPLQPDTDRDGFTDGREVATGNNPAGPGKLPRE
jgi:hypothetical protein